MCDLAYTLQVAQIEREALAQVALLPHLGEGQQITPPETAVAEFDKWLTDTPEAELQGRTPEDAELIQLIRRR